MGERVLTRKSEILFWVAVPIALTVVVAVTLIDSSNTALLALVLLALVMWLGHRMATEDDRGWLPGAVALAFVAKLIGAGARYLILVRVYNRVGDATGYHEAGRELSGRWEMPPIGFAGDTGGGTLFMDHVTGLIYTVHQPSFLGGFLIFATLAFLGQLLFYAAFRHAASVRALPWYGAGVLFLPSLLFWPSSIGKESLMLLFLGVGAYGVARLLGPRDLVGLPVALAGFVGAGAIRVHIAALLAIAAGVALLMGRVGTGWRAVVFQALLLGGAALLIWTSVSQVSETFGIGPSEEQLDPFLEFLETQTTQGGSSVQGAVIDDLSDIPRGTLRVLFRPLPHEAHNTQALASAVESAALLALIAWKTPRMIRHLSRLRSRPYLLLSLMFVGGFVVSFSTIFNLGILARQRTQALPFLLAVLVGLSVRDRSEVSTEATGRPEPVSSLR